MTKLVDEVKECTSCKNKKYLSDFVKSKKSKSGYGTYCKECVNEKRRVYLDSIEYNQVDEKICVRCLTLKSIDRFHKDRTSKDNHKSKCMDCSRGPDGFFVDRNTRLLTMYRITVEDYDKKLNEQGGACAICKISKEDYGKYFSVDHDHSCCPGKKSCGKCVRDLLCSKCNVGIGNFDDDSDLLLEASNYLLKHRNKIG